jgi:heme/copper-type cytochrome/quinol oxidase subunit 2
VNDIEVDKMAEKKDWGIGVLVISAIIVGLFIGMVGTIAAYYGILDETREPSPSSTSVENVKVFTVDVYHWDFSPSTLEVEEGDYVVLVFRSTKTNPEIRELYRNETISFLEDQGASMADWESQLDENPALWDHSISISAFDIIFKLEEPNQVVTFSANEKGTFEILCTLFCGIGHNDMKAELIVS